MAGCSFYFKKLHKKTDSRLKALSDFFLIIDLTNAGLIQIVSCQRRETIEFY
jgi:hypothetical protein